MTKRIGLAAATIMMGLCLAGGVLAGETKDKYKDLDQLKGNDKEVTFAFKGEQLSRVFGTLEKVANLNISFGEGFPASKTITGSWDKGNLKDALINLAEKYALTYDVTGPDSMVIKGAATKP